MRAAMLTAFSILGSTLVAQTPVPTGPTLKFRGALWASGVTQNQESADGSLVFRPLEAGPSQFSVDGVLLGVDTALSHGWSAKVTLLGGQMARIVNASTGDSGSLVLVEALAVWTGEKDTLRLGRMITFMGMEFLDGTQNLTASRGLLFTFGDPFGQVGINWHRTFDSRWSSDLWAFNGEDRVKDNNHRKTFGLGLNYNHGGASDKFLALQFYRGPEQDGLGAAANSGVEGRQRERVCLMGQWVWGASTLQGEASLAREAFPAAAIQGATAPVSAHWRGYGLIYRFEWKTGFSLFTRGELFSDDEGVRLGWDPSIKATVVSGEEAFLGRLGANLRASSLSLGLEKKWGLVSTKLEVRRDALNVDLKDAHGNTFREGLSGTVSLGMSF